jgi:lipopolysaccharide/colanic/teichoic acid biosynthesis glycosyltransferase
MRAVALVAGSMRLRRLRFGVRHGVAGDESPGLIFTRRELARAARLAHRLERNRGSGFTHLAAARMAAHDHQGLSGPIRLDARLAIPLWKRSMDLLLGTVTVVVTAPLWASAAVLVRRSSPGPILFRQLRIGLGGLPFVVYKFRTMYVDNDDSAHRRQNQREMAGEAEGYKDEDDPRITPIGRWLRRLSLDELPQLINVVRGEMSLVGPRPSLLWEMELFPGPTRRRLTVPPGITGLWQTSGRADLSMPEMLELDLRYVDELSPGADLRCLVRTAGAVVGGEGAT